MTDDKKKPFAGGKDKMAGGGARGRDGAGKPFAGRKPGGPRPPAAAEGRGARPAEGAAKKPFQRQDGAKRAFSQRGEDGRFAKPRPGKWERGQEKANEAAGERSGFDGPRRSGRSDKPFVAREGDAARPRGGPRPDGARPERPYSSDKPRFNKPRSERPYSDKPRSDRPYAEKPRFDRPRSPRPDQAAVEGSGERIARRLARAGVASRRDAEEMIAAGRITLNGKILDTPAINVSERDRIEIDGRPIPAIERTRLFLFHKPAGVVTTSRDPEGRKTVFDVLPDGLPRLMTVGRLDINTEGLLLLTNDGGLSRVLELPATGWLRRYRVRVHGQVEQQALDGLKEGVAVDGVFYGAVEAVLEREQGSNAWLSVGLREGKNREVKNILGSLGLEVTRLIRVSFGPFQLGDLGEGELRELKGRYLREQLGERLIEEAGADFDAPVLNPVASQGAAPNEGERPRERGPERGTERSRERTDERPRERRENRREDALGRLDTRKPPRGKPGFGSKPGFAGKPGGRDERPEEKPRSRSSNVWMAPGAKPMGEKKKAALAERNEGRRYAGKPRPDSGPGGRQGGKPGGAGGRPGGSGGFSARPGGAGRGAAGRGGPRKPRGEG